MVIINFETYVKTYVLRLLSNQQRSIVTLEASLTEVFSIALKQLALRSQIAKQFYFQDSALLH